MGVFFFCPNSMTRTLWIKRKDRVSMNMDHPHPGFGG